MAEWLQKLTDKLQIWTARVVMERKVLKAKMNKTNVKFAEVSCQFQETRIYKGSWENLIQCKLFEEWAHKHYSGTKGRL